VIQSEVTPQHGDVADQIGDAEARARSKAQARKEAEARVRSETQARAQAELRLRAMEAELKRLCGGTPPGE
jgi:hypothetical protein